MTSPSPDGGVDPAVSWRRNHWMMHLERHAFQTPDHAALRFGGTTTTWRQLRDRVARLTDVLARRGVAAGERVAVLMSNRPPPPAGSPGAAARCRAG